MILYKIFKKIYLSKFNQICKLLKSTTQCIFEKNLLFSVQTFWEQDFKPDLKVSSDSLLKIGFIVRIKYGHSFICNNFYTLRRNYRIHRHLYYPPIQRLKFNRLHTKCIRKGNRSRVNQIITESHILLLRLRFYLKYQVRYSYKFFKILKNYMKPNQVLGCLVARR